MMSTVPASAASSALTRADAHFTVETPPNLGKRGKSMASDLLSAPTLPAAVARDGLGMAGNRAQFLKALSIESLKPMRNVP